MDLEQKAIERIKTASEMSIRYYGEPLVCMYSGGKDSDVMLELFRRSGVPFEAVHNLTRVDAPQTVQHTKKVFEKLDLDGIKAQIQRTELDMWQLIVKKQYPPTRVQRYCCEYFKEDRIKHRFLATGVRWDESRKRQRRESIEPKMKDKKTREKFMLLNDNDKKRRMMEQCELQKDMIVNHINDWPNADIWEYYRNECTDHNPLYDMGYTRVGCIGCPMAGKHRYKEFKDFPTYERAYKRAFGKMLQAIHESKKETKWENAEDVFRWWMEDDTIKGQLTMEEYLRDIKD